jgi:hypothetical protein
MQVILVCIGNFQEYILDNIRNLRFFGNKDIVVITDECFAPRFEGSGANLVFSSELNDYGFNSRSQLWSKFRNGFLHFCSLRLFLLYAYLEKYDIQNCVHIENDTLTYVNFDDISQRFPDEVCVTRNNNMWAIPCIIYIPNYKSFSKLIENYDVSENDMVNLGKCNFYNLPIFTDKVITLNVTENFKTFNCVFDPNQVGHYLGGVDPRNEEGDTRGRVYDTCAIKFNAFEYFWKNINGLYVPFMRVGDEDIRIINLHIHCKRLHDFMADGPKETGFIKFEVEQRHACRVFTSIDDLPKEISGDVCLLVGDDMLMDRRMENLKGVFVKYFPNLDKSDPLTTYSSYFSRWQVKEFGCPDI